MECHASKKPGEFRIADSRLRTVKHFCDGSQPLGATHKEAPMKTLLQNALFIIVLGLIACQPKTTDSQADRDGILQANTRLENSFKAGDLSDFPNLFTDSAVVSPVQSQDVSGLDSLTGLFQGFFQGNTISMYSLTIKELEVYGTVAYDRGTFRWESKSKKGQPLISVGRYHIVHHRGQDGLWRIHRLIENQVPQ
jgi:ketosteroid isomerase-like protein